MAYKQFSVAWSVRLSSVAFHHCHHQ